MLIIWTLGKHFKYLLNLRLFVNCNVFELQQRINSILSWTDFALKIKFKKNIENVLFLLLECTN